MLANCQLRTIVYTTLFITKIATAELFFMFLNFTDWLIDWLHVGNMSANCQLRTIACITLFIA